jgi:circadian clock protein KaiC
MVLACEGTDWTLSKIAGNALIHQKKGFDPMESSQQNNPEDTRASTGIAGLDDILGGGFPPDRIYLVQGEPGVGKTTLAFQFLLEGVKRGEKVFYITMSETHDELLGMVRSHGWSMNGIDLYEMSASEQLKADSQHTIFHPVEVEFAETMKAIMEAVERAQPRRVVFDSLSELRVLAGESHQYHRQILSLKQFFNDYRSTVLLLDGSVSEPDNVHLRSLAHGVLVLEQLALQYGQERRRLRVLKVRGLGFRGGYHDYVIGKGGLRVFPRLLPSEHRHSFQSEILLSGISELDAMLGGGLHRGSSLLLVGPSGTGKTTRALQYVSAAASRGERAAFYSFDESLHTLHQRASAMGIELTAFVDGGLISLEQIDPVELSPGEFAHNVRQAIERDGTRLVVIDSLNGYVNAMPEEHFLILQMHELLTYLGQKEVTSLLINTTSGMPSQSIRQGPAIDVSYLTDAALLFHYFELGGEIRQAISVLKRRTGPHDRTIRELRITATGISIGESLRDLRGVLTGTAIYDRSGGPKPYEPDGGTT